ncbi:MAG: FprA family A-type flavoprotein [Deltaproteobacteria bacterium]|nr:FprA family A-type flavoprotein [Deltaproteobacteria bacterium]MCL5278202.1 FprA family A-type flavoprotein [Deltaproteobacteria bacterium]
MGLKKIKDNVFWAGAVDWDRRLFDSLIPIPDGTSYNAYLIFGKDKTALLDTVDPSMTDVLMQNLKDVKSIDFIISHHAEQDHSGSIPAVLGRYGNAKVVTSSKGKALLVDHLHIPDDRIVTVEDGARLDLGGRTLEFIYTPWVHWPETMVSYLHEDKILFTCDLFGSHLAVSGLYCEEEWKVCESAKRYYAEVMMPFRTNIKKHLERLAKYDTAIIAPSHGPLYNNIDCIVKAQTQWVSDAVSNEVIIPYVSMHGSTRLLVDYLTDALAARGIKVERFDLTVTDLGKLAIALVDAATVVIGSPTVLTGAHPIVISAVFLANALRPKLKFSSIVGSYGWGGRMIEDIQKTMPNLKAQMLEPVLVKGKPDAQAYSAVERLAQDIAAKHHDMNIL